MSRDGYAVFAGHSYYPSGGWHDHHATYASKQEAIRQARRLTDPSGGSSKDWTHVVDLDTGDVVWDSTDELPLAQGDEATEDQVETLQENLTEGVWEASKRQGRRRPGDGDGGPDADES